MTAQAGEAVILSSGSWCTILNMLAFSRDDYMSRINATPDEEDTIPDKEMLADIEDVRERIICQLGEKKMLRIKPVGQEKIIEQECWQYLAFYIPVTDKNRD